MLQPVSPAVFQVVKKIGSYLLLFVLIQPPAGHYWSQEGQWAQEL